MPLSITGLLCGNEWWTIYCKAAHSTALAKYSTVEFRDGNPWSSKINEREKPVQSARLVIQFDVSILLGMMQTCANSLCSGPHHVNLEGLTIQDGPIAPDYKRRGSGHTRFLTPGRGAYCAPVFKRIKSNPAHTS
jgi:hypothetical protein